MDTDVMDSRTPSRVSEAERDLLEQLRAGESKAFHSLLRPHLAPMLALARRLAGDSHWAEDLLQETLIRAFKGLARFRGESSLRTWLFRILTRLASQPGRWRQRHAEPSLEYLEIPDHLAEAPEILARERELQERLEEAMERLTMKQRTALHLRAVEGLDYKNIATVLGGSASSARMLVLAARRKIMERMGRHLEP
ncbi:MAG: RNA polymerase sigma factor [Planctomycetota bacterium]|nr:RNA polymerase sigma factor [Planctomycetota bacterium]